MYNLVVYFKFSFVFSLYNEFSKTFICRTLFCEKYIVPRTTAAGKYISLYRKIRDHGCYVHSVDTGGVVGGCGGGNGGTFGRLQQIQEDS